MTTLTYAPFHFQAHHADVPSSPTSSVSSSGSTSGDDNDDELLLQTPTHDQSLQLQQLDAKSVLKKDLESVALYETEPQLDLDLGKIVLEPMSRLPSHTATPQSLVPLPSTVNAGSLLKRTSPAVLVIGLGYVGEHLLTGFAGAYSTTGFDVSSARCAEMRHCYGDDKNVTIFDKMEDLDQHPGAIFDLAVISVPTLIKADGQTVDYRHVESAVATAARYARPGSTVVMESSVSVGCTRRLLAPLHQRGVHIGFSPERVDPGRAFPAYHEIPKVISGIDEASLDKVDNFYKRVFKQTVRVASLETAEFCKLYENCQRLMLIAFVNEAADACEQMGVDISDVCAASATKPFGYTPFTASLGAGGHCLPVNPFYLLANGHDMPLLRQATEANAQRPLQKAREVMKKARGIMQAYKRPLVPRVLIYGLAYKAGTDCLDYSCAVALAKELTSLGAQVCYFDPCVTTSQWQRIEDDQLHERSSEKCQFAIDDEFDVIAVCQKPTLADQEVFSQLQRCQVVQYAR